MFRSQLKFEILVNNVHFLIQDFTLQPTYIDISFHQTAINAWIWSAIFHAKDTNFTEVSINYKIVNL